MPASNKRRFPVRVLAESPTPFPSRQRGQVLRPHPRRKILHVFDNRPLVVSDYESSAREQASQPENDELSPRVGIPSVRGRRCYGPYQGRMGAHRGLILDLDGDHLDDARRRRLTTSLLQFDAARVSACLSSPRQAAGSMTKAAFIARYDAIAQRASIAMAAGAADRLGKRANYYRSA